MVRNLTKQQYIILIISLCLFIFIFTGFLSSFKLRSEIKDYKITNIELENENKELKDKLYIYSLDLVALETEIKALQEYTKEIRNKIDNTNQLMTQIHR